ncbi:hypothetical protein [uncultured Polaribacter sp.]|mgnify:FL=1|uniref:hypothetical protein n=1 Tax=uncultured Polaribacter sp. TaxID=174711 RepID=UPI000AF8F696|nr:hypothetical protein [Polaribacter sp.]|tara:strand:+ start:635 stop:832 length:198 start_codon:yes stop_codon:yes gene_type:complete
MRNKNVNLFIVAFAVITIIASLVKDNPTNDLFGYEVDSWFVRILWLLIGLVSYKRYKDKKEEEAN